MSEEFNATNTNTGKPTCLDKANYGECTKGEDCIYCNNISGKLEDLKINEIQLNTGAANFIPKSKRVIAEGVNTDKLNLNLDAKEFIPKPYTNLADEDENADLEGEEFDMIVKDIIDNDAIEEEFEEEEESDEDKWFPKYKDCECCKGFVYKCEGVACSNMEMCYCKMKEECDEEDYN